MKQIHLKEYPQFNPNLNPFEMAVLGVKGGMLFDSFLKDERPKQFKKSAEGIKMEPNRYHSCPPLKGINHYSDLFDEVSLVFKDYGFKIDKFYAWYSNLYYNRAYNTIKDTENIKNWSRIRKLLLDEYLLFEGKDPKDNWKPIIKQCLLEIATHYEHKLQ